MSFFDNIFGKKPKVDPAKQKELERKRQELEVHSSIDNLRAQHEKTEVMISSLEKKIEADTKAALAAKNAGQKDKALRYLAQVKSHKAQISKYLNLSMLLNKQMTNLQTSSEDAHIGDIISESNKVQQRNNERMDKFMETLQDTAQLNNEFEMNQEQINDIIGQTTAKYTEGLDEEFDKLGDAELMDAMKGVDTTPQPAQKNVAKKKDNFNTMIDDLLN